MKIRSNPRVRTCNCIGKQKLKDKDYFCSNCKGIIFGFTDKEKSQAKKQKRILKNTHRKTQFYI